MRLLRVLRLGAVEIRPLRHVLGAEQGADLAAQVGQRVVRQVHRVGSHVGDVAGFVQALRRAHRPLRRETELARGVLLQGRGDERRRGAALALAAVDPVGRQPPVRRGQHALADTVRVLGVADVEFLQVLVFQAHQAAEEFLARLRQVGLDGPVLLGPERLDLALALDDHAQRRALHPAGRQAGPDESPQQRRQVEADQVVERPPRLLRVDQVHRKLARVRHRLLDRLLGNFRELDAVERNLSDQPFLAQDLVDVPGNGLAFAVEVGCEIDRLGLLRFLDDGADVLLAALVQLVGHREIVVGIDRAVARRQVADVAIGGQDLEVGP